VILLRDVSKRLPAGDHEVEILRRVNGRVAKGEMVCLVGPSGAGKTTLLNLIAGVDQPSSGEVLVHGQALASLSRRDLAVFRRDTVGMVFQNYHLLPNLSALENASLPLYLKGLPAARARRLGLESLERVGLTHRVDHLPEQLSGGERQRVAISRALAVDPPLLLADEPTGSLDSENGAQILELLADLHARLGTTMLLVTHDAAVARFCSRTVHLRDGRLSE
jgi:putative ABC transport system ATP-binding protein